MVYKQPRIYPHKIYERRFCLLLNIDVKLRKGYFICREFWFRKINRVNAIIAKFLTILKLQPNRATLRNDLTQAVR